MKPIIRNKILTAIVAMLLVAATFAQPKAPPPPPPPGEHGTEGNFEPAATIGSGLLILLSLGLAYGSKKLFEARERL